MNDHELRTRLAALATEMGGLALVLRGEGSPEHSEDLRRMVDTLREIAALIAETPAETPGLRDRIARWFVDDLGYSRKWPKDKAAPPWALEKADRILALYSPPVEAASAPGLRERIEALEAWMPGDDAGEMKTGPTIEKRWIRRDEVLTALRAPPASEGLREAVMSAPDCGDNSCHYAMRRGGQRTNGGCRCTKPDIQQWANRLRAALTPLPAPPACSICHQGPTHPMHSEGSTNGHRYVTDYEPSPPASGEKAAP